MIQIFSSLKKYFTDLWRRCFGKEYLVKAMGESPVKHDFRKCPGCGEPVPSLNPFLAQETCKKCKAILHAKGVYIDHKTRTFTLRRPLHGKYFVCVQIVLLVCIVIGLFVVRIVPVPDGYYNEGNIGYAGAIFFGALIQFLLNWFFKLPYRKIKDGWMYGNIVVFFAFGAAVIFIILSMDQVRGHSAVPFWIEIPSQQEVYARQKAELAQAMTPIERYRKAKHYASNPEINLADEFLLAAKSDLPGLMEKYPSDMARLGIGIGTEEEYQFYAVYSDYLVALKDRDSAIFDAQCVFDPWNLATAWALQKHPKVWKICE